MKKKKTFLADKIFVVFNTLFMIAFVVIIISGIEYPGNFP